MGEYQNFLVKADTERLLEVLQNIIENAIKYGSDKKIGISISREEDCVLITVENTGEVLPAEELPHLLTASIVAPMQEARKEADWGFIYAES